MTYCYFFLILGNLSLLTVAASSFLSLTSCSISVFSLFVLTIGCTLGFFLYGKNPKLRFLSLLVFPLAFWGVHDLPTAIGVTFITIYAVFVIFKSQFVISYNERHDFFFLSLKILVICAFPLFTFCLINNQPEKIADTLLFVLISMLSTLMLTQILRHDISVIQQPKFFFSCIGVFASVFLLVSIVKSNAFWVLVRSVLKGFYRFIFAPFILILINIIGKILWFIVGPFYPDLQQSTRSFYEVMLERMSMVPAEELVKDEWRGTPSDTFLNILLVLFFIAAFIVCILFLVRLLKKVTHRIHHTSASLTRSTLASRKSNGDDVPLDLVPPTEPRKAVRYYYRCFLRTCKTLGLLFSPDANSFIVARDAREYFQEESLHKLYEMRDIYIKARYSKHQIKSNDVNQIKLLYEELSQEEIHQKKKKIPKKDEMLDASYVHLPPKEHENFDHLQN